MAAEQKELRQLAPADVLDFLDAAAMARNMERSKLIIKILVQWSGVEAHRSNVLQRVARGNPVLTDSPASTTDWGDLS